MSKAVTPATMEDGRSLSYHTASTPGNVSRATPVVVYQSEDGAAPPKDRGGRSSISVSGPTVSFNNIGYTVTDKKTKAPKKILQGVSGVVEGGALMFIMGPSGAGKSTMLDALAGRLKGDVAGSITVDGEHLSHKQLTLMSKYVQQEDVHIPVLTVEETLRYTANLYTTDVAECKRRVDDAIAILGLELQRHTRVGNFLLRGLSGGQKRRLSVGVELVAKPRVLFLDEPTSGLDSTSAFSVVSSLRNIAHQSGTTMLLSIHQPAERLFLKADSLLLLTGGRAAYSGPIDTALAYFGELGHTPPPMRSSSEFLLDLVNADFADSPAEVEKIVASWAASPTGGSGGTAQPLVDHSGDTAWPTGFVHQTAVLSKRMFLNSLRNPLVIWLRMALYVVLSIMIGTVWIRIGANDPKSSVVQDLVGALFFIAAFMVFMSVSVMPAFIEEKAVFIRERANGTYRVSAYNLAHFLVDIPFIMLLAVVCGSITYWLVGFNPGAEQFVFFLVDLFLSFFVAESMMILIASIVPDPIIGIAGGAMVYGGFMVVQGFFIKLNQIGWYWRWMHYIGLHSYSFSGFMYNEFHGRTFAADPDFPGGGTPEVSGDNVLRSYDFEGTKKWQNMAVLVAMVAVYRTLAYVHMVYKHTGRH